MTQKFLGEIVVSGNCEHYKLDMPSASKLPPKKEWYKWPIWQFNGRVYLPLTEKAVDNLNETVKMLQSLGYTCARKVGKIKKSSIKYMVSTYGVEDFYLAKA